MLIEALEEKSEEEIAKGHSDALTRKAQHWLNYLEYLLDDLRNNDNEYFLLKCTSLWVSTFAYIEWLTGFHTLKGDKVEKKSYCKVSG